MKIRLVAERLAAAATLEIGRRFGDRIPFYYVAEYPKSGGTWLARMVADYLQLPFPQHSALPVTFPCIVQTFTPYRSGLNNVFYLYRDGRDVMVSLYFDRLRVARHDDGPGRSVVKRTYEKLLGRNYDPGDIVRHLPKFIEFEFRRPGRGSSVNWRDHVLGWQRARGHRACAFLSYEGLVADCKFAVGRAMEEVTREAVDHWRLETAVEKMSMVRQVGRKPGEEDPRSHVRKGVVGDWRNYFSVEAAEVFWDLAGEALAVLGYEGDASWVAEQASGLPR